MTDDVRGPDPMEMILSFVPEMGEDAYAIPIRERLEAETGKNYSLGSLYGMLGFLEIKGKLDSYLIPGGPERGGRPKKIWVLAGQGPLVDDDLYRVE